jgi:hypothetical protein
MGEAIRIPADQVSPALRALFDTGQPVAIRCFAVLDGAIRGQSLGARWPALSHSLWHFRRARQLSNFPDRPSRLCLL